MSGYEAKVPALRFKVTPAENAEGGLLSSNAGGRARTPTAPWVRRRLADVAEFDPKCILPDSFEYVDLESVVGTEIITHRTESKTTAPSRAQRLAKFGDVFYQTVRPYQKNNCIFTLTGKRPFVFSTGYAQLRPKCDGYFLLSLLQNDSFVNRVLDECTGTSYPAINDSRLSDIPTALPSDSAEQRRIGSFFRSLDALIAGRGKALEKLEALKKSMLLKMFPQGDATVPEVRFKGFAGDWEKKRLGDVVSIGNGKDYKHLSEGNIPVYGTGGYMTSVSDFLYDGASVCIGRKGTIDVPQYLEGKFWTVDTLFYTYRFGENFPYFIYCIFQTIDWKSHNAASGVPSLSKTIIEEIKVVIPTVSDEQQKIGAYFRSLDALISARRDEIAKLKDLKKALLDRMFV